MARRHKYFEAIRDESEPVNDQGVPGITAQDVACAYASIATYRFSGVCGPFKVDPDESSFARWCKQTGRNEFDDEAASIYDGSRDAFAKLNRRHGVMRSYAIVDSVAGLTETFDNALPDFGSILKEVLAHIEETTCSGDVMAAN